MPISEFHPTLQEWFSTRLGEPTPPQREGWPHIRAGRNTLIAAPTGSGKTLAAFFSAMDALAKEGPDLPDETRVVYVSPLKALSNDVQKNLQQPLQEIRELNPFVPDVRVLVRTGDTTQRERAAMVRKSPHILVTTPESLYILLTSDSGRRMLSNVRTAIVDEAPVFYSPRAWVDDTSEYAPDDWRHAESWPPPLRQASTRAWPKAPR